MTVYLDDNGIAHEVIATRSYELYGTMMYRVAWTCRANMMAAHNFVRLKKRRHTTCLECIATGTPRHHDTCRSTCTGHPVENDERCSRGTIHSCWCDYAIDKHRKVA